MVSERTLKKWRTDALYTENFHADPLTTINKELLEMAQRVLVLTQILMDQKLLKRG